MNSPTLNITAMIAWGSEEEYSRTLLLCVAVLFLLARPRCTLHSLFRNVLVPEG